MSLLGTQVLLHGSNSSTSTYHKADAISTVSGLKETRAVHECVSRGVNDIARGVKPSRADDFPDRSRYPSFSSSPAVFDRVWSFLFRAGKGRFDDFSLLWTEKGRFDHFFLLGTLLLNPPGSAQLTWLLDNPPGFWTIQLALSTAPEQNHAPSINCALCTHFGKRAQNWRRMGQAYFTRLWTSAERSGNSATRTTSLEGEPSGTNSVRVPTVCGYLLFRSREGGGQNPYHISYWRLFARIDLELFVLNSCNSLKIVVFITNLMLGQNWHVPNSLNVARLDISTPATFLRPNISISTTFRCLDVSISTTSRHLDVPTSGTHNLGEVILNNLMFFAR
ncbi:uncharacterized protein C8R40DRAFT_1265159 [Lentinula edodes]|uniref:uncharacterized protein n=1 Tax=Lentinula edodes TaxID=5353 RepID=UPI001E8EDC57|nr:uncharacterized protein C8R40DRAFT_1265159 [Lentinula edodes]KAH7875423.1 hypothetical protein C8R40DRAFT_1265159 [Lentinula edodes]